MKQALLSFAASSLVGIGIAPLLSLNTSPVLAQTAGCGSGWSNTIINRAAPALPIGAVDVTIAGRQFRVACDEHDACYDTFGSSKQECDRAFRSRTLGICARDHNTILGTPLRLACERRAAAFYTAVSQFGQSAYDDAQRSSRQGNSGIRGGVALRNQWSGKCLQTMGQEKTNGSTVNIWDCTNTTNQFWSFTARGELRNNWSGKCLQTMGQDRDNGSLVNIWDCTGTSNQLWERTSSGEARNQWSGKCLQTMGQERANGSPVNIWDCTNTSNQFWR